MQVSHNRITCCVKFWKKSFLVSDVTNVTYDTMWRHFLKKLTLTIVFFHRKALTRLIFVPSALSTIAFLHNLRTKIKIKNLTGFKAIPSATVGAWEFCGWRIFGQVQKLDDVITWHRNKSFTYILVESLHFRTFFRKKNSHFGNFVK